MKLVGLCTVKEINMFETELREMRDEFIKEHNIECKNCEYWEKNRKGKCASKVYCIVRDNVFNCNYRQKKNPSKESLNGLCDFQN